MFQITSELIGVTGWHDYSYDMAVSKDGTIAVTYDRRASFTDPTSATVLLKRYSSEGDYQEGVLYLSGVKDSWRSGSPQVAFHEDGSYSVIYSSLVSSPTGLVDRIYIQTFDVSGQAVGHERILTTLTSQNTDPRFEVLSDGRMLLTYNSKPNGVFGLHFETFTSAGVKEGPPKLVFENALSRYSEIDVGPNGQFAISWGADNVDSSSYAIMLAVYGADGQPILSPVQVNEKTYGNQRFSDVAFLKDGSIIVVWSSPHSGRFKIYGRQFSADGVPLGGEFQISDNGSDAQGGPSVDALDTGGFVVAWEDVETRYSRHVKVASFDKDGELTGNYKEVHYIGINPDIEVVSMGGNRFGVSWNYQSSDSWNRGDIDLALYSTNEVSSGDDALRGKLKDDSISGLKGDDSIVGLSGDDTLSGDRGYDDVSGGLGDDLLKGGAGADTLDGGANADTVLGGNGRDTLLGGEGADRLEGQKGLDYLAGGGGDDTLIGGRGNDTLKGGQGNDRLFGNLGADKFVFDTDKIGQDVVRDFQSGTDVLRFDDALWDGNLTAQEVVDTFATVTSGRVVFDFGDGNEVVLTGVASVDGLADDILIF